MLPKNDVDVEFLSDLKCVVKTLSIKAKFGANSNFMLSEYYV